MFKLKYSCACFFLLIPSLGYAGQFCTADPEESEQLFADVKLTNDMLIGEILTSSELFSKKITCRNAGSVSNQLWAAVVPLDGKVTNIYLNKHSVKCSATETSYPGIGVVWYNYNSSTSKWACGSSGEGLMRGLSTYGGQAEVADEFYLVKTASIVGSNSNYTINNEFIFNEKMRLKTSGQNIQDNGRLYSINIKGTVKLEPFRCNFSTGTVSKSLSTLDILDNKSQNTIIPIDITCSGLIDPNSSIILNPNAKAFALNSSYFETSDPGIGVKLSYSASETSGYTEITSTAKNITTKLDSNKKSRIYLLLSPYIENNSGVYPSSKAISFDSSLSVKF